MLRRQCNVQKSDGRIAMMEQCKLDDEGNRGLSGISYMVRSPYELTSRNFQDLGLFHLHHQEQTSLHVQMETSFLWVTR
jgi:hypothetical protein